MFLVFIPWSYVHLPKWCLAIYSISYLAFANLIFYFEHFFVIKFSNTWTFYLWCITEPSIPIDLEGFSFLINRLLKLFFCLGILIVPGDSSTNLSCLAIRSRTGILRVWGEGILRLNCVSVSGPRREEGLRKGWKLKIHSVLSQQKVLASTVHNSPLPFFSCLFSSLLHMLLREWL